jgi:hypothetical protein
VPPWVGLRATSGCLPTYKKDTAHSIEYAVSLGPATFHRGDAGPSEQNDYP